MVRDQILTEHQRQMALTGDRNPVQDFTVEATDDTSRLRPAAKSSARSYAVTAANMANDILGGDKASPCASEVAE